MYLLHYQQWVHSLLPSKNIFISNPTSATVPKNLPDSSLKLSFQILKKALLFHLPSPHHVPIGDTVVGVVYLMLLLYHLILYMMDHKQENLHNF